MTYNNDDVRRRDRLLDEARAREILREAEYGILSMTDPSGRPYGIPINFVWDGADSLYMHCAPVGKKLEALSLHPEVSFCVVGRVHLLSSQFTTEYESVILKGTAHIHLGEEERWKALELILDKFSPEDKERGLRYAQKSFARTQIIRVDLCEFSGKRKYVKH